MPKYRKVTFSKYSELRVYANSGSSVKSYSKAEQKQFQVDTALEANRIRNLLGTCQMPTGYAIRRVIKLGLLSHEDIVGLEHLLSEEASLRVIQQHKSHIASVLGAQDLMIKRNRSGVNGMMLAKIASTSSLKCIQKARVKALLGSSGNKSVVK